MNPPIPPHLVQACSETKFFVLFSLWLWAPFLVAPCLQQSPPCLSKTFSVSKSSCKTLALQLFSGDVYPWLLPLAETGRTGTYLKDGRWRKRTKTSQLQSLAFSGVFKVEMFTTALAGAPFPPPKWRHSVDLGLGCPRPGCLFQQECWDGKGRKRNKRPCVCLAKPPWKSCMHKYP